MYEEYSTIVRKSRVSHILNGTFSKGINYLRASKLCVAFLYNTCLHLIFIYFESFCVEEWEDEELFSDEKIINELKILYL